MTASARVSVVLTVLNEERRLDALLRSLLVQTVPIEILVCDAGSSDSTRSIAQRFADEHEAVRVFDDPGTRGHTRNAGVGRARTGHVAFIDGDCVADPNWLERLLEAAVETGGVVAGTTITLGKDPFRRMARVELPHKGQDVTHPSCNLMYPRGVFQELGGFDPRFVTAEDIDLNFRAVEAGHPIRQVPGAIVRSQAREDIRGFLSQAYWNGYGRKQLTLKHGRLWGQYSLSKMLASQFSAWGLLRMAAAVMGYMACKLRESPQTWRMPLQRPGGRRS